jgi:hypothetical protein
VRIGKSKRVKALEGLSLSLPSETIKRPATAYRNARKCLSFNLLKVLSSTFLLVALQKEPKNRPILCLNF